jgi:hypothetical protein
MYTNTDENPLVIYIATSIRALIKSVLRPTIFARLFIAAERQAPRWAPSRRRATSIAPSLSFEADFGETFCATKKVREVGRSNMRLGKRVVDLRKQEITKAKRWLELAFRRKQRLVQVPSFLEFCTR